MTLLPSHFVFQTAKQRERGKPAEVGWPGAGSLGGVFVVAASESGEAVVSGECRGRVGLAGGEEVVVHVIVLELGEDVPEALWGRARIRAPSPIHRFEASSNASNKRRRPGAISNIDRLPVITWVTLSAPSRK